MTGFIPKAGKSSPVGGGGEVYDYTAKYFMCTTYDLSLVGIVLAAYHLTFHKIQNDPNNYFGYRIQPRVKYF